MNKQRENIPPRSPDNARFSIFGISDFTSFVDFLTRESHISGRRDFTVLLRNSEISSAAIGLNLSPLLCGIILVSKTPLGLRFDFCQAAMEGFSPHYVRARDIFIYIGSAAEIIFLLNLGIASGS